MRVSCLEHIAFPNRTPSSEPKLVFGEVLGVEVVHLYSPITWLIVALDSGHILRLPAENCNAEPGEGHCHETSHS